MSIEELLRERIQSLRDVIHFRDTDLRWPHILHSSNIGTNGYHWVHNGGHDMYVGRVQGLVMLLEELRSKKKNEEQER